MPTCHGHQRGRRVPSQRVTHPPPQIAGVTGSTPQATRGASLGAPREGTPQGAALEATGRLPLPGGVVTRPLPRRAPSTYAGQVRCSCGERHAREVHVGWRHPPAACVITRSPRRSDAAPRRSTGQSPALSATSHQHVYTTQYTCARTWQTLPGVGWSSLGRVRATLKAGALAAAPDFDNDYGSILITILGFTVARRPRHRHPPPHSTTQQCAPPIGQSWTQIAFPACECGL